MKKLLFIISAIFICASVSFAQQKVAEEKPDVPKVEKAEGKNMEKAVERKKETKEVSKVEQRAESQTKKWTTILGLSNEQIVQVKRIFLIRAEKIESAKARYAGADDKKQMEQEIMAARTESDNALKGVLTAEQYSAYLKRKEENNKSETED